MTAPAEDPRSGECQQSDWCGPGSHCLCPPAAGRGDTDSSGEAWTAYVVTCQRCASAARPAVDRAEPPEGLRVDLVRRWSKEADDREAMADRLTGPGTRDEVRRLRDRATIYRRCAADLRRALGGPS